MTAVVLIGHYTILKSIPIFTIARASFCHSTRVNPQKI